MNPLVSIITPSYNQGRFIEETIQSVLSQDYPCIEHIIIDGRSSDNTLDILRKYQDRNTWISEKDNGQSDAINKGFKMAKGEILVWLNSDDTYLPGAISAVVDYFRANPEKRVVYGRGYYVAENGSIIMPHWTDPLAGDNLAETFYICQPAWFIHREVIEKIGLLNTNLHHCMDYEFAIRIRKEYPMGYLDKYLANLRLYRGTKSSHYKTGQAEILAVQRKYFGKISFNIAYRCSRTALQAKLNRDDLVFKPPGIILKLTAIFLSFFKFTRLNHKLPTVEFIHWLKTNFRISRSTV